MRAIMNILKISLMYSLLMASAIHTIDEDTPNGILLEKLQSYNVSENVQYKVQKLAKESPENQPVKTCDLGANGILHELPNGQGYRYYTATDSANTSSLIMGGVAGATIGFLSGMGIWTSVGLFSFGNINIQGASLLQKNLIKIVLLTSTAIGTYFGYKTAKELGKTAKPIYIPPKSTELKLTK